LRQLFDDRLPLPEPAISLIPRLTEQPAQIFGEPTERDAAINRRRVQPVQRDRIKTVQLASVQRQQKVAP
jgi:hypothetical protein